MNKTNCHADAAYLSQSPKRTLCGQTSEKMPRGVEAGLLTMALD